MKKILFLSIMSVLIMACKKESTSPASLYFGFENYEIAAQNLGVYVHVLDATEGGIIMRETTYGSDATQWDVGAIFRNTIFSENTNGGDYYINNVKFVHNGNLYAPEGYEDITNEEKGALVSPLYGQTNEFKLIRDGEKIFESDYYIPESLKLTDLPTEPGAIDVSTSNSLTLSWNADANNENGVVFYLFSNGVDVENLTVGSELHRAIKVEDTGTVSLDKSFFEDLPIGAYFTLQAIRGNAELSRGTDDLSYNVYSMTEHQISCKIVE